MAIDQFLFNAFHSLAGRSWIVDGIDIFFAQWLPYLLVLIALYLFIFREQHVKRRVTLLSYLALSFIVAQGVVTQTIQFLFPRERPFTVLDFEPLLEGVAGYSFPSSHAVIFFTLAFVMFAYSRRSGWWFLLGAFLIGTARIVTGVHWPLDILGGIVVAGFSVWLVKKILPKDIKKPAASVA